MANAEDTVAGSLLNRRAQFVLTWAFLCAICLPAVRMSTGNGNAVSRAENRVLAAPPDLSSLRTKPGLFLYRLKAFIQDNFGFRTELVKLHATLCLSVLRSSPSGDVIVGKHGWLYQRSESALDDYRRVRLFTDAELGEWAAALEARHHWLAERGIAYVFAVAPNTHTIYPEHLPDWARPTAPQSRLDQLMERLRQTPVNAVDLRPALHAAKAGERLYNRTDTHWNERGAFVAYTELMRAAARHVPELTPLQRSDLSAHGVMVDGGDLAGALGLADAIGEEWLQLRLPTPLAAITPPWENQSRQLRVLSAPARNSRGPNPGAPSAVVFHDSFGVWLTPLFAETFRDARFAWINEKFDTTLVEAAGSPSIVVQEITERFLMRPPPKALGP